MVSLGWLWSGVVVCGQSWLVVVCLGWLWSPWCVMVTLVCCGQSWVVVVSLIEGCSRCGDRWPAGGGNCRRPARSCGCWLSRRPFHAGSKIVIQMIYPQVWKIASQTIPPSLSRRSLHSDRTFCLLDTGTVTDNLSSSIRTQRRWWDRFL